MEYIYAVRVGQYVKIGRTDNLPRRLKQLGSRYPNCTYPADLALPMQPVLVGVMSGANHKIERAIHDAFDAERVVSEWFHWTPRIATWCERRDQEMPPVPGAAVAF